MTAGGRPRSVLPDDLAELLPVEPVRVSLHLSIRRQLTDDFMVRAEGAIDPGSASAWVRDRVVPEGVGGHLRGRFARFLAGRMTSAQDVRWTLDTGHEARCDDAWRAISDGYPDHIRMRNPLWFLALLPIATNLGPTQPTQLFDGPDCAAARVSVSPADRRLQWPKGQTSLHGIVAAEAGALRGIAVAVDNGWLALRVEGPARV